MFMPRVMEEFFKQSNTRLHFIATRAMDMTSGAWPGHMRCKAL